MTKKVLLLGGNSDIAVELMRVCSQNGYNITTVVRRFIDVDFEAKQFQIDLRDVAAVLNVLEGEEFDVVVYAAGVLYNGEDATDPENCTEMIQVNFEIPVKLFNAISKKMEQNKEGVLIGISSVAAVRGKASNHIYSASKAGFDSYLTGLRQQFATSNLHIVSVRPGFVNTKMLKGIVTSKRLTASSIEVAHAIYKKGICGKRNIIYVKPIWRPLMFVLRNVPEFIYKCMKL